MDKVKLWRRGRILTHFTAEFPNLGRIHRPGVAPTFVHFASKPPQGEKAWTKWVIVMTMYWGPYVYIMFMYLVSHLLIYLPVYLFTYLFIDVFMYLLIYLFR